MVRGEREAAEPAVPNGLRGDTLRPRAVAESPSRIPSFDTAFQPFQDGTVGRHPTARVGDRAALIATCVISCLDLPTGPMSSPPCGRRVSKCRAGVGTTSRRWTPRPGTGGG